MGRPVFFSVSSRDIANADAIARRFSGDIIYLYTRTGVDGADFWDEIERAELSQARGLVIFWSRDFLRSAACRRELELAASLLASGQLKHVAILRLDDLDLSAGTDDYTDAERAAFDHFAHFTARFRASTPPYDADKAFQIVDRLVREATARPAPIFPRPHVIEALRSGAKDGEFSYRPAVWVSGFNGYGRRTAIREFYRTLNGNATALEFDISELALPLPLLLLIEERALGADGARLTALQAELGEQSPEQVALRLAQAIEAVAAQQRYIILRQTRVHEERALPPEWIVTVIKALRGDAPILFLTVQVPPPDEMVIGCKGKLGTMRMTGLGMLEADSFVRSIITAIGNRTLQWDADIIARIVKGADGNPELITKIVALASTLPSLENLDAVIGAETEEFATTMTHLARWSFSQLQHDDERRALLILNDLALAGADDIADFLRSERPMADILGALERVGLVERDEEDLYRLSPVLSNRLSASLVTPDLIRWHDEAVRKFIAKPVEIDADGHGMVSVQARIAAAMSVGAEVPEGARQFVTAANYLQSGIRAYRANRFDIAQKLLREAFVRRDAFTDTARREAARFYGLVCARQSDDEGVSAALAVLDSHYLSKPVAHFIRGFQAEFQRDFPAAVEHYEKARKADEDVKQTNREGITIRYLVSCLLRMHKPNYDRAIKLADRAARLNSSAFVLMMRARAYLHRHFRGAYRDQQQLDDWWHDYEAALKRLEQDAGAKDFYFQVRAEEAMMDPQQGAVEAINWMREAVARSDRFDHRLRLWQYMARSGETTDRLAMMREIEQFVQKPGKMTMSQRERHKMIDFYAQALGMSGSFKKFQLDQIFPSEAEGENLHAHRRYGKGLADPTFLGDAIDAA